MVRCVARKTRGPVSARRGGYIGGVPAQGSGATCPLSAGVLPAAAAAGGIGRGAGIDQAGPFLGRHDGCLRRRNGGLAGRPGSSARARCERRLARSSEAGSVRVMISVAVVTRARMTRTTRMLTQIGCSPCHRRLSVPAPCSAASSRPAATAPAAIAASLPRRCSRTASAASQAHPAQAAVAVAAAAAVIHPARTPANSMRSRPSKRRDHDGQRHRGDPDVHGPPRARIEPVPERLVADPRGLGHRERFGGHPRGLLGEHPPMARLSEQALGLRAGCPARGRRAPARRGPGIRTRPAPSASYAN